MGVGARSGPDRSAEQGFLPGDRRHLRLVNFDDALFRGPCARRWTSRFRRRKSGWSTEAPITSTPKADGSAGSPPRQLTIVGCVEATSTSPSSRPSFGRDCGVWLGYSNDETYGVIETEIAKRANPRAKLLRQEGTGKGDAVRRSLPAASAWCTRRKGAMRFRNLVGASFFSLAFSWLHGQTIQDTLCGTKALRREDYQRLTAGRAYFGDFDVLFGAAKLGVEDCRRPGEIPAADLRQDQHPALAVRLAAGAHGGAGRHAPQVHLRGAYAR